MEIIRNKKCVARVDVSTDKIPIGTVFTGKIGGYDDEVFLRTYNKIVSLNDPGAQWEADNGYNSPTVRGFKKVTAKLIIEEE